MQRAAIHAPLQLSATDLVMSAIVNRNKNRILQVVGWRIVLQVHEGIILKGQKYSAETSLPVVVDFMNNPIEANLLVSLTFSSRVKHLCIE